MVRHGLVVKTAPVVLGFYATGLWETTRRSLKTRGLSVKRESNLHVGFWLAGGTARRPAADTRARRRWGRS